MIEAGWTGNTQVEAHRNSNWADRGGHIGTYHVSGHGRGIAAEAPPPADAE